MAVEVIPVLILFLVGMLIATLGSMTGLGGGFLCVPFLILAWGLDRPEAVLLSLTMILANSTSSSIIYLRKRMVDLKVGLILIIGAFPALFVGFVILESLEAAVFDLLFAIVLLISITYIVISRTKKARKIEKKDANKDGKDEEDPDNGKERAGIQPIISIPVAFVAGLVSSLFGIGGGAVLMPLQVGLLKMKVKTAIATSMFMIMFITGFRVLVISKASFDLLIAIPLCIGAVLGAQIGAQIVRRLKGQHLLFILAAFLISIAFYMGGGALIDLT